MARWESAIERWTRPVCVAFSSFVAAMLIVGQALSAGRAVAAGVPLGHWLSRTVLVWIGYPVAAFGSLGALVAGAGVVAFGVRGVVRTFSTPRRALKHLRRHAVVLAALAFVPFAGTAAVHTVARSALVAYGALVVSVLGVHRILERRRTRGFRAFERFLLAASSAESRVVVGAR